MKKKKQLLKRHQRIGLCLVVLGILICFIGYNSTLAALTGIALVVMGSLALTEPYLWG